MLFKYILLILPVLCSPTITINKITPNSVEKEFTSEINVFKVELDVSFTNEEPNNIMLFIRNVIEPFDPLPREEVRTYCKNGKFGEVFQDLQTIDKYYYSCCFKLKNKNCKNNCTYTCPLTPAPTDLQFIETIQYKNPTDIYTMSLLSNSTWQLQDIKFTYIDPISMEGVLKKTLIWIVCLILLGTYISHFMNFVNKFSNKYPFSFTILHISFTIFFLIILSVLFYRSQQDYSNRGVIINSSILFSIIKMVFSLYLIYIPHKKDPQDPKSIEQRFKIRDDSCKNIFTFIRHKYVKHTCTFIFLITTLLQGFSTFSIVDSMYEYLDASLEVRCAFAIWYTILSLVFFVAFITAIYEVTIPIRLNKKTGQFLQSLPELIHHQKIKSFGAKSKIFPTNKDIKRKVGIFSEELNSMVPIHTYEIQEGDVLAIDNDEIGEWDVLIWKIGTIKNDNIIIDEDNIIKNSCFNLSKHNINLQNCDNKNDSPILVYISYNNRLVKIGKLKNNRLYRDYNLLIKAIGIFLKFIPDYEDEDYNVNIVENMRTEFHKITHNIGSIYSYFYVASFIIIFLLFFVNIGALMLKNIHSYSLFFYIFECVLLCVFAVFCFSVSNYIDDEDYHEQTEDQTQPLIEITRGDVDYESSEDEDNIDWPELVGETVEYAKNIVSKEYPNACIIVLGENEANKRKYVQNTILLIHNQNKITKIPCYNK